MRSTLRPTGTPYRISVATVSAVFRVPLTRTISRALPRTAAAMAQAQPTLPVPTIPIFIDPFERSQPDDSDDRCHSSPISLHKILRLLFGAAESAAGRSITSHRLPPHQHPWPQAGRSPTSRAYRRHELAMSRTGHAADLRAAWEREGLPRP